MRSVAKGIKSSKLNEIRLFLYRHAKSGVSLFFTPYLYRLLVCAYDCVCVTETQLKG